MTTDLPEDNDGDILFGIEDKVEQLSNFMTLNDLEIDEKDIKRKLRDSELNVMIGDQIIDPNENDINIPDSLEVENFMNKVEVDLGEEDPSFIFPEDRVSHNYVNLIRQSNKSFQQERDKFLIPPPLDRINQQNPELATALKNILNQ